MVIKESFSGVKVQKKCDFRYLVDLLTGRCFNLTSRFKKKTLLHEAVM